MEDGDNRNRLARCYEEWISKQEADLDALLQAKSAAQDEVQLQALVVRSVRHYEDYSAKRRALPRADVPALFCPAWCNSFEGSLLWIGGCRSSMFIRLVYTLSGSEVEARLDELLTDEDGRSGGGGGVGGGLVGLSASQLGRINDLHCRTVRAEDRLSARMATLQEDIADKPLLPIIKDRYTRNNSGSSSSSSSSSNGNFEGAAAIESYVETLSSIMEEADGLRVRTVKELATEILTPQQAVELLAAANQLHLSVHEWGRIKDLQHGRA